jgi:predicted Zn-dependent protease
MRAFTEAFILEPLPPGLRAHLGLPPRLLVSKAPAHSQAGIEIANAIALGAEARTKPGPTLVLTGRDLITPTCESLFGFADRRQQVAVISTARLDPGKAPNHLLARVHKLMTHELGHLNGLSHCPEVTCAMHPSSSPTELDTRSDHSCGHCPTPTSRLRQLLGFASALVVVGMLLLGVERLSAFLSLPPFTMPFS